MYACVCFCSDLKCEQVTLTAIGHDDTRSNHVSDTEFLFQAFRVAASFPVPRPSSLHWSQLKSPRKTVFSFSQI